MLSKSIFDDVDGDPLEFGIEKPEKIRPTKGLAKRIKRKRKVKPQTKKVILNKLKNNKIRGFSNKTIVELREVNALLDTFKTVKDMRKRAKDLKILGRSKLKTKEQLLKKLLQVQREETRAKSDERLTLKQYLADIFRMVDEPPFWFGPVRLFGNHGFNNNNYDTTFLNGTVSADIFYRVKPEKNKRPRTGHAIFDFNSNNLSLEQISEIIKDRKIQWFDGWGEYALILSISLILDRFEFIDRDIDNMPIGDVKYIKLPFDLKANEMKINNNCVNEYLIKKWGDRKNFKKIIKKVTSQKIQWTAKKIVSFLEDARLPYKIFRRDLTIYRENDKYSKRGKTFYSILSNEHLYEVTKKEISLIKKMRNETKIKEIKYCEDLEKLIDEESITKQIHNHKFVNDGDGGIITRVQIENILYVDDMELVESYKLFNKILPYDFPIRFNYKLYDPLLFMCKQNKLYSFNSSLDKPSTMLFNNPEYNDRKEFMNCIDSNKNFISSILSLDYFGRTDLSTHINKLENNHKFNKYYLYHIKKFKLDPFGLLDIGWISGHRIQNMIDYVIIDYYIKPILIKNPFKDIIKQMLDYNESLTKHIINIFVGVCQIIKYDSYKKCKFFVNNEIEAKALAKKPLKKKKINDKLFSIYEIKEFKYSCPDNLLPIALYIIDNASNIVIKKMMDLINMDKNIEITKIKIDSITFISKNIDMKNLKLSNKVGEWKKEEVKTSDSLMGFINWDEQESFIYEPTLINKDELKEVIEDYNSVLIDCYAGSGKTYYIRNNIIPLLDKDSYIVLSATHKSLEEYYKNKENAKVIQTFTLNPNKKYILHKYKTIIIEECGLFDYEYWYTIISNLQRGQQIIALGDKNQLLPVKLNSNDNTSPLYNLDLRSLFHYYCIFDNNYRNHYTRKQYNQMINMTFKPTTFEMKLLNKINDINICYYNITKDKINKKVTQKWKQKINNLKVKSDGKFICTTQDLYKDYGIFNNCDLILKEWNDEKVIFDKFEIPKDLFTKKNFDYGYCHTIYRIQGSSIPYNKLGLFDTKRLGSDGRTLYTVLSRIQTKEP